MNKHKITQWNQIKTFCLFWSPDGFVYHFCVKDGHRRSIANCNRLTFKDTDDVFVEGHEDNRLLQPLGQFHQPFSTMRKWTIQFQQQNYAQLYLCAQRRINIQLLRRMPKKAV